MLMHAFSRFLLVMDYQVNKDFIAQYLCANKAKPQLACNGQCYLQKNLEKSAEAEKDSASHSQKVDVTLFYQLFLKIEPVYYACQATYLTAKPILYEFTTCCNTFQPPQVGA